MLAGNEARNNTGQQNKNLQSKMDGNTMDRLKTKYGTKDTKIFKTPFADRSEGLFTLTGTAVIYSINVMFSYCTLSIRLNIDR